MDGRIILALLFFLTTSLKAEELCGLEPPKEGESCSGSSNAGDKKEDINDVLKHKFVEKPMTEEEEQIWARRFYSKSSYTNNYDWKIRDELDIAEEHIPHDNDEAIALFDKILESHPKSPRALYIRARVVEAKMYNSTNANDPQVLDSLFKAYFSLMERYQGQNESILLEEYDVMPVMFSSLVHHTAILGDTHNRTDVVNQVYELAFEKNPEYKLTDRLHAILIQNFISTGQLEKAEKAIKNALDIAPENFAYKFFHGILLKIRGQKKEGNALLRNLSSDAIDLSKFSYEMSTFGNELQNCGKPEYAKILYQECSKMHIFPSAKQRPIISNPSHEIEALPIWDVEENVGLTAYDEELSALKAFLPNLQQEAMETAAKINEFSDYWRVDNYHNISTGNFIRSGNLSTLSVFHFGKRRRGVCQKLLPKTCAFFKANFERPTKFKIGLVKLSVMEPGAKTFPLTGLTNLKLTLLVPVQIPKEFGYRFDQENAVDFHDDKWDVVDSSFEHVFDNEKASQKAIWLSIDIPHPELTAEEEANISITDYAKHVFLPF